MGDAQRDWAEAQPVSLATSDYEASRYEASADEAPEHGAPEYGAPEDDDDGGGRYRGRRRLVGSASRRAAKWGTAAVVAAVGVVLVGSGVLARTLSDPITLPVLPPSTPTPVPTVIATAPDGISRLGTGPTPTGSPTPSPVVSLPPPSEPAPPSPTASAAPDDPTPTSISAAPPPADSPPALAPDPAPGPADCHVEVVLADQWSTGFRAEYTITNNGPRVEGWTLTVTVPSGVELSGSGWQGTWTQQGTELAVANAPWNEIIRTGRSVVTGHQASHPRSVTPSFSDAALNGVSCTMS